MQEQRVTMATIGFDDSLERTVADEELNYSSGHRLSNAHLAHGCRDRHRPGNLRETPPAREVMSDGTFSCQSGDETAAGASGKLRFSSESDTKAGNITSVVVLGGGRKPEKTRLDERFSSSSSDGSEGFSTDEASGELWPQELRNAGPKVPAGAFQRFRDKTLSVSPSFLNPFRLPRQLNLVSTFM